VARGILALLLGGQRYPHTAAWWQESGYLKIEPMLVYQPGHLTTQCEGEDYDKIFVSACLMMLWERAETNSEVATRR